jgi:hypothetical protein
MTGAFLAMGLWIPAVLAITTVVLYLLLPDPLAPDNLIERRGIRALLLAIASTTVIWLIASVVGASYASADRASPSAFAEIVLRLGELGSQLATMQPNAAGVTVLAAAVLTVRSQADDLERLLGIGTLPSTGDGTRWIRGTGYIEAWRRLHVAEQAVLSFAPVAYVVDAAIDADLRLDGSFINARDELRRKLAWAVEDLDSHFSKYRPPGAHIGD